MRPKAKKYLVITIILLLASSFLLISINKQPDIAQSNKIVGSAITELSSLACAYAEKGGTCFTQLPELGLITPEECCREIGKCCSPAEITVECIDCGIGIEREEYAKKYKIKHVQSIPIEEFDLPENYSVIYGPFNAECTSPIELTINVPLNYQDTKILKCEGEKCYLKIIEKTITTYMGDLIIDVTKETEELKPELIELKTEEVNLDIDSFQDLLKRGGTEFYGGFFENLTKTLYPKENVEERDELKILAEFLLSKDEIKDPIELPFTLNKNIHGDAIGLFAKKQGKWISVGSAINKETKTILADIENISQFIHEDNISLAIMGVKILPTNVTFERIYNPAKPSRDAVILVHGLATTTETFNYLIKDMTQTKQPFQIWAFGYSSTRYIDEIANDLSEVIENNIDKYDRIFIVAHSMGGIIAQQALYNAHQNSYSYIDKVKKAILIAVPNEGSIVAEAYEYLFSTLVQKSIGIHEIFRINEKFVNDLTKGRIIPRVRGIDYYVIAGTRPYTEGLIGIISRGIDPKIKFDGVVAVKSAQNIGGEYINDMCRDYWEVNMTHMELVDDFVSRQIIGKIISEEVLKTKEEVTLLGENRYYKTRIEECSPDINYLVIGKKAPLQEEETTLCKCGDGICGIGEYAYNCPADCAEFFAKKIIETPWWVFVSIILIILALLFVMKKAKAKRKNLKKHNRT